jgi:sulfonate transport system permease protein
VLDGSLAQHAMASLKRLLIGFGLGGIVGTILGFCSGMLARFERVIGPTIRVLAPIPPVAWIPLLVIVLGIGEGSKIGLITIGTFFVMYLASFEAVRSTDQRLVDVGRVFEKGTWEACWTIFVPSALPPVLVGIRTSLALSWILLIAAEVIASAEGLGWFIWDSRNFSRPADMIVGMIAVGALGGFSDWLVVRLSRPFLAWRTDYEARN